MKNRYVVGFDGSEPSWAALNWALERGGPVVVAHVVDADDGMAGADFRREVEDRADALMARVASDIADRHPEVEVTTRVLEGPVAWALADVAEPDDILVIGTHKTGFLHGRVLGSRSVEVALLARCDVMVMPTTDLRFRSGVVAGVSAEPGLAEVVRAAARAAADRGEDLLLVHGTSGRDPEREREVLASAIALARAVAPGLVIQARASNRQTAELLLDASRDRALLVLGSGSGDRARSPIGSVLHDVLLNITAPALVTRRQDPAAHVDVDAARSSTGLVGSY